jgi:diacylglycerol kinase family enzyme
MNIDALRVKIENSEPKYVCCIAAYGFMADVIQYSDGLRLFGPIRYDIVGTYMLFLNKSYRCNIRYKVRRYTENLQQMSRPEDDIECQSECKTCRSASLSADLGEVDEQEWHEVEDDYMSIMVMNHACVSEKSPFGMYRFAHLSNGNMTIISVKKCSWFQYLMFLKSMSDHGKFSLTYIQSISY